MINIDFNTFLDKIKALSPQDVEMLAGQMAQDPNAVPPQIGEMGLAGAMEQMQKTMTQQDLAQAPSYSSPLVNQGMNAQGPMDSQQGLASLLAGPKAGAGLDLARGGPQAGKPGDLAAAMQALQTREQSQQRQSAPYISNLNFGAATPAKGLGLQAPAGGAVPSLGALLAGQRR